MRARIKDPSLSRTMQAQFSAQVGENHSIYRASEPNTPKILSTDFANTVSTFKSVTHTNKDQRVKTSYHSVTFQDKKLRVENSRQVEPQLRLSGINGLGTSRDTKEPKASLPKQSIFQFDQETFDEFQMISPKYRVNRMRQELKSKALSVIRDKFDPKSVLVPLQKQEVAKEPVYRSELSPVSMHL